MGAVAYVIHIALSLIILNNEILVSEGILYPIESETRELRNLDGIWNFLKSEEDDSTQGIHEKWYIDDLSKIKPTIAMPVPASYNDITTKREIRDHVGTVWYDRKFFIPKSWSEDQLVWIRFGSVHYEAYVWINGIKVAQHEIGHLPFEAEISKFLNFGKENRVTVLCDNVLNELTVPQGKIEEIPNDYCNISVQSYSFDFFNYAGIHRSVHLYTTPKTYISDVEVITELANTTGIIYYKVTTHGKLSIENLNVYGEIRNKEDEIITNGTAGTDLRGVLEIPNAILWWPYLMDENYGYLYELKISLIDNGENLIDVYRLKVGIRSLTWNETSFLINNKPIYFRGFGRHEDSDIRGKGLDLALIARDFNLLKWIGANAICTSHYPYSEESMQFADENGIMIMEGSPSVRTEIFKRPLLQKHISAIRQLIQRDKNHPSVVMWSIATDPSSNSHTAKVYYKIIANFTKTVEKNRPITAVIAEQYDRDQAAQYLDIISFNCYNGWYSNTGRLDMITKRVIDEATAWNKKHNKPVLMSEYGADTLEGLHLLPSFVFTENYQVDLFSEHFKAFDKLRQKKWFIGEFVWNFADFKTTQDVNRIGGNKKGIFTRSRQPKASAHLLRQRYFSLGQQIDKCQIPEDLFVYVSNNNSARRDNSEFYND